MEKNLFREEALKEITSPESLDQVIKITSRRTHLLVLGFLIILITGVVWGEFGSIPVMVEGNGIIMPEGGVHYVLSAHEGTLRTIEVGEGHYVNKNEVLGELEFIDENGVVTITNIVTEINGRISEIRALQGDYVNQKEKIISVVASEDEKQILSAIILVPAAYGKIITPGMTVQVDPFDVNKEAYGYVKGVVESISLYPVSQQRLLELLGTESLVSMLSEGKAVLEMEIQLISSEKTISGYEWSTPKGPPFKIYEGTLCKANVLVETKKPLQLIFPEAR